MIPPKSPPIKESKRIIKPVLRGLGFLGVGLLAVLAAMVLIAACTVTLAMMAAQERQQRIESAYSYQSSAPPQWTPDGKQVVFADRGRVYSVDAKGTSMQLIHDGEGEEDRYYAPDVSPDGARIAYLKNYRRWPWESRHPEIATSALDGTDERVLTDLDYSGLENPSWSPDGSRIAFAERGSIYTITADGSDLQVVADQYVLDDDGNLAWSPDGRRLAFVTYGERSGDLSAMITIGVDGSNPMEVGHVPGQVYSVPAWSP